jgi:hypothetical protein
MHTTALLSTAALAFSALAAAVPTSKFWDSWPQKGCDSPFTFTSTYHVVANPDQVYNGSNPAVSTPGQPGAIGYYNYGINSELDVICYVRLITLSTQHPTNPLPEHHPPRRHRPLPIPRQDRHPHPRRRA